MKTRILHTKVWQDELVAELSPTQKLLFIYYLTNDNIGLTGIYKLTDRQTAFDTGLTQAQIADGKMRFERAGKIFFYENWVYVVNSQKLNGFYGEKLEKAIEKEKTFIGSEIWDYFDRVSKNSDSLSEVSDTSINHKSEIINHKEGVVRGNKPSIHDITIDDLNEIAEKYQVTRDFVDSKLDDLQNYCDRTGKTYKDYKAALREFVKKDANKPKIGGLKEVIIRPAGVTFADVMKGESQ